MLHYDDAFLTFILERLIRFLKLIRNALTNEQKPAIDLQCYVQYVQQVWHSAAGKQLSSVPKRIRKVSGSVDIN